MAKENENIPFFGDLPTQPAEPAGFSFKEMVRCDECLRANPPTRINCLYCGVALPLTAAAVSRARPSLRPLEQWEQGFNDIVLGLRDPKAGTEVINQVAKYLGQDVAAVEAIFTAKSALPVARAATREEATLIERRLAELGVETVIVSDQDLQVDSLPPRRLRSLAFDEAGRITAPDEESLVWADVSQVILGRLFVKQVELRERRRRRAENEILDSSEFTADEAVVDLYAKGHEGSWRIIANSFDFSCLGKSKSLLAGENFPKLLKLIRDHAPTAEFNDSYATLRHCLEPVWPSGKRVESGGLRVRGSKYITSEVITTSNETQFTRYSRLCRHLKDRAVQP